MNYESVDAGKVNISGSNVKLLIKPCAIVPSKPTKERVYDTSHNNIGDAIVFNQVHFDDDQLTTRYGSGKDVATLKEVLTDLEFKFTSYDDLTVQGIRNKLKQGITKTALIQIGKKINHDYFSSAAAKDYSNTSCLMIFVLTHGDSNGKLCAKDGEYYVEDLYNPFIKNTTLHGKPKMFFLQACRGSFSDVGVIAKRSGENHFLDVTDNKSSYDGGYTIPNFADIVIMYATVEGVVSFRDTNHGSWLIQNLCEEIRKNPREDILSLLTDVNSRVAHDKQSFNPKHPEYDLCKQMPVVKHTLTKKFFFTKTSSIGEITTTGTMTKIDKKSKTYRKSTWYGTIWRRILRKQTEV